MVKVTEFHWPKDSKGRKMPKNVGKLPWDHLVIKFLADLTHRIRSFGEYVFALAAAPKSTLTCTMVDAYRLKHNFGYWIPGYHSETLEIFGKKSNAL